MLKQFWHTLHNSVVLELQICCSEQKKSCKSGWDPSAFSSALQTHSTVRQVVWARESEVGNEVQGLLNPLLIRPSASILRAVRRSAHPPPIRPPSTRPPIHLSFAPRPSVRMSASRPPRPHLPKITYHFLLLESFLPLVRHVRLPHLQFMAPTGATVASG